MNIKNLFIKTFLSLVVFAVLFVVGTSDASFAGGVAMQVKVRLKLQDGTIINNPPTDIRIDWDRNPLDPEGDGCNNNGSLFFGASAPPQGQSSSNDGESDHLYDGTSEAYVWVKDEDGESPTQGQWVWLGRSDASVGPCGCINRRATITLNGITKTSLFKAGGQPDGGGFNNWSTILAEFDFDAPPTVTPTTPPSTSNPQLGDLIVDAGSGAKGVGGSQSSSDVTNSNPRKYAVSGKRSTFEGGNFYNPLDITQNIVKPTNVSLEDSIDYVGVAFGHAVNSGGFGGSEPFPTSGNKLNAFRKLKQFVDTPPTSVPTGPGLILLYAYNRTDPSTDELFTTAINPEFEAGSYYIYLPKELNKNEAFGQWYKIPSDGTRINIPDLPGGNACTIVLPNPTCYLQVRIGSFSDTNQGSLQWETTIYPNMGSSDLTEVSFLKPKGQNKNIYKQQQPQQ